MCCDESLPSSHITTCGLPGIDEIPYGLHACHVYGDRDQLVAALVPYFTAGLQRRERCIWATAAPLPAHAAIEALRDAWRDTDQAIDEGALVIVDGEKWYANGCTLKGADLVPVWLREEERALADGYRGLRITGNVTFLAPQGWKPFIDYEHEVSAKIRGRRIVALCSYLLEQCTEGRLADVLHAHHCAFEHADGNWRVKTPVQYPRDI